MIQPCLASKTTIADTGQSFYLVKGTDLTLTLYTSPFLPIPEGEGDRSCNRQHTQLTDIAGTQQ